MERKQSAILVERIEQSILLVRGEKVMLDADLAQLYGVETRVLVQAVRRNLDRFPSDFMFRLSMEEFSHLRSQVVTSRSWGGRRYPPYAFTEHGVAMLSGVLKSERKYDSQLKLVFAAIHKLMTPPEAERRRIGFRKQSEEE